MVLRRRLIMCVSDQCVPAPIFTGMRILSSYGGEIDMADFYPVKKKARFLLDVSLL